MKLHELMTRIRHKLASRDVGGVDLRAVLAMAPGTEDRIEVAIEARDDLDGLNAPWVPILRVRIDLEQDVVECDTLDAIDEARWAAIGIGYDAAPLRASDPIPF